MADTSKRCLMPVLEPEVRNKSFSEVALGYTEEQAVCEAKRCLDCKHKPCVSGCPVMVNIPEFIKKITENRFDEAYRIITETNSMPAVCGRVCPQETQCEAKCVRGIKGESVAIGRLERYAADRHLEKSSAENTDIIKNNIKIAIVGSGPAGLACAGDLIKKGYDVTIFEALHTPGGVLVYGIPEFRLPKSIVEKEIQNLKELGVEIRTNIIVGRSVSVDELLEEGYKAVFIATGAGLPNFMNIPGENLNGVYSANEFLTRVNLMKAYLPDSYTPVKSIKKAAVVGGGNVAMDAARCAKRLGADEVYIIYRRSENELPARAEEVEHAKEEGIIFKLLTNPTEITGDDNMSVTGIKCVEMVLVDPDEKGRRRPAVKPDSEHFVEVDTVIMAVGTSPNPLIKSTAEGMETQSWGGIITDDYGRTSKLYVYAGGDAVTGAATVILAMGAGKKAAEAIDGDLKK